MKKSLRWWVLLLLFAIPILVALLWPSPMPENRYTVREVGPGDVICATTIDTYGRVAGWDWGGANDTAVLYLDDGKRTRKWEIPSAGFPLEAMNNHGDLVGKCELPGHNGTLAFRLHGSTLDLLPAFGGRSSHAFGINDKGEVVGSAATPDQNKHACVWRKGIPIRLRTLPGWSGPSEARGINSRGEIVGNVTKWTGKSRGVLWHKGRAIDLGDLPGRPRVEVVALNDRNQVIGWAGPNGGDRNGDVPFLWDHGVMRRLPGGERGNLSVCDINNAGVVVGDRQISWLFDLTGWLRGGSFLRTGSASRHAVLWKDGQLHDLNHLASVERGCTVTDAYAINDRGQIVATVAREVPRAVLLTPTTVKR